MNGRATSLVALLVASRRRRSPRSGRFIRSAFRKALTARPNLAHQHHATADGKPDFSGIWMIYTVRARSSAAAVQRECRRGIPGRLPFQPWAADLQKKRAAEGGLNDPDGLCLPQGLLQYHVDPQPLKIVQTPKQILIIYESNYGLRTIYMDGRTLPPLGQPQPFWHGYSVGRWEGDTLVVESNNFRGVDPSRSAASSRPASMESDGSITEAARIPRR